MLRHYKERSRNTDNSSARVASGGLRCHTRLSINHPVDFGVAQDDLHIFASFREWNGFDELGNFIVAALGLPGSDAVFAGVISSGRVFQRTRLTHQARNVNLATPNVVVRPQSSFLRLPAFDPFP